MKAVLLNSGGLDSALLAHKLAADGVELHSLYVATGQLNEAETMAAAEETARRYCVSHEVVRVDFGRVTNALYDTASGRHEFYAEAVASGFWDTRPENGGSSVHNLCPHLGVLVFAVAATYATMHDIDIIYSAWRQNVVAPDLALRVYNLYVADSYPIWQRPRIELPFTSFTTYAEEAQAAGVADLSQFSYTHSCRMPEPCGRCSKCVEREQAGVGS